MLKKMNKKAVKLKWRSRGKLTIIQKDNLQIVRIQVYKLKVVMNRMVQHQVVHLHTEAPTAPSLSKTTRLRQDSISRTI